MEKILTTVILRKKRQVTIPKHLCEALEVDEEDLLTIDIQKVIIKRMESKNKPEEQKKNEEQKKEE